MSKPAAVPQHVAIIMDGNGRWAQRRGQARTAGHEAGSEALKRTIRAAIESGVSTLTVYAFSSENWRRPQSEIRQLLELFLKALNREIRELDENNVKLIFIGNRKAFSRPLREGMARAERRTANNSGLLLNIAVSYGGQADIVAAAQSLARQVEQGRLKAEDIDLHKLSDALSLARLPPPDLFIRTGGEKRLSNFLLWQLAYTELYFTDVLWPDFDAGDFAAALKDFAVRERRFGGLTGVEQSA